MLLRRVELNGGGVLDVRLDHRCVTEMGRSLEPIAHEVVVDGHGGALLPGLHDHHIHLLALAAARRSIDCGPPAVCDAAALTHALRRAATESADGAWVRGVGY